MTLKDTNGKEYTFWHEDYEVGCGGTEIPMNYLDGKTYLYVWNPAGKHYAYYVYQDDVFIPENAAPWVTGAATYTFGKLI